MDFCYFTDSREGFGGTACDTRRCRAGEVLVKENDSNIIQEPLGCCFRAVGKGFDCMTETRLAEKREKEEKRG